MNLKQFKYILVLAEAKSFSKAAGILNVSQPSLSQYVKYLEKEVGIELFDRCGSDVRITDAGKAYIEAGKQILDLEHQLQNRFSDIKESKSGTVKIGTSLYRGTCLMSAVVSEFKKVYPSITVIIDEKLEKEMLDDAEHGMYDIFITALPINEKRFLYEDMFSEKILLAAPKSFEIKTDEDEKVDIKDLNGTDFICLEDNQLIQSQWDKAAQSYNVCVNKIVECRNIVTQLTMVNEGIGCAIVPSGTTKLNMIHDNIAFYSFKQELPTRKIVAAYMKNHYMSEAIKYFIDLLKKI